MSLLAFTHRLTHGGAQLFLVELLDGLCREGGFVCSVVSAEDGPLRGVLESRGIPVRVTARDWVSSRSSYEAHMDELAAWAAPRGFNVALANTIGAYPGADLAGRLGLPLVWAIHESFDPEHWWAMGDNGSEPYLWERLRVGLREAAAVIFEAEETRRQYLRYGDAERLATVPFGISLEEIARYRRRFDRGRARRRLGLADDALVILSLGTIEPRKAQAPLAMAFAGLAGDYPETMLALVGETTGLEWLEVYATAVHRYVHRAGLGARVMIAPVTSAPYEWLGVADLFVLASDVESLPRVVLEAMAFGLPVMATAIFGNRDLIDDGRTGYLCSPRDVGELGRGIRRALASSPRQRQIMGRAAAEVVRNHHDNRDYTRRISRLLHTLALHPRSLPGPALVEV